MAAIMRTSFMLITAAVCLSFTPALAQRGPLQPPLIKEGVTEKISDHVYVIPDGSVPIVPNIGIIVGTKGTLVVDTGLGARNGQTIMREVGKVTKGGDLYLAVTHIHPEHDLGARLPGNTKMMRSRDQEAEIDESVLRRRNDSRVLARHAELLKGAEFRKPINSSTKS